jgi:hypothetical protein
MQTPAAASPDGKLLVFAQVSQASGVDLWTVTLDGEHEVQPLLATQFSETVPSFSRDGNWLAYASNESGRLEVYVQRFPSGSGKQLISTQGGSGPIWSPDGRELFYRNGDQIMSVAVVTQPSFVSEVPRLLFERRFVDAPGGSYDVAQDGRFLVVQPVNPEPSATQISVVLNWTEELKRLVPTN